MKLAPDDPDRTFDRDFPERPQNRNLRRGGLPLTGRPKGTKNKVSAEVKDLARRLTFANSKYVRELKQRLMTGKLAPLLEFKLWAYGYGEPTQTVEFTGRSPIQVILSRGPDYDPMAVKLEQGDPGVLALPEGESTRARTPQDSTQPAILPASDHSTPGKSADDKGKDFP